MLQHPSEWSVRGTLQSFWLRVVCRLTGWSKGSETWMMLEKQTIRHATNARQAEGCLWLRSQVLSYFNVRFLFPIVSLSLSLSLSLLCLCPSDSIFACQLAKNRLDALAAMKRWFLSASVEKWKVEGSFRIAFLWLAMACLMTANYLEFVDQICYTGVNNFLTAEFLWNELFKYQFISTERLFIRTVFPSSGIPFTIYRNCHSQITANFW